MFIDHRMPEDGIAADSKSKANFREAALCVEIVKYFLLQGYRTDQIVVLTPYLDQSRERLGACFRRQMLVKPSITIGKTPSSEALQHPTSLRVPGVTHENIAVAFQNIASAIDLRILARPPLGLPHNIH